MKLKNIATYILFYNLVFNANVFSQCPTIFNLTGGGSYCAGSGGTLIKLNSSEIGVTYQLWLGPNKYGAEVAGTGNAIIFTNCGASFKYSYYVIATRKSSGCSQTMTGNIYCQEVIPPGTFEVTGGGNYCSGSSGVPVGLNGSEIGVSYQLKCYSSNVGTPITGTGSALNFGFKPTSSNYYYYVTANKDGCIKTMNGQAVVKEISTPTVYDFIKEGATNCAGSSGIPLKISGSDYGAIYQVSCYGSNTGDAKYGDGKPLSMGNFGSAQYDYRAYAKCPATGKVSNMSGQIMLNQGANEITGDANVEILSKSTYKCSPSGGKWQSSNTNALINETTGEVTGNYFGTSVIWYYLPNGCSASKSITVIKKRQIITFDPIPEKTFGDPDFEISATLNNGYPLEKTTNNANVAVIRSGKIHITGAGTCNVIVSRDGDFYTESAQASQSLSVRKANQNITFNAISKNYGNDDFDPAASTTSGLAISYTSGNTNVATIVNGKIHIVATGTATIYANQSGNSNYNPAPQASAILTVTKANQTITFNPLPSKTYGNDDFDLAATTTSNLTITYTSSNANVATIVNNKVRIIGAGTCTIYADQTGNANYNAAPQVSQTLTINKANQTITFSSIPDKTYGDADFSVSATATSNLPVTFRSGNPNYATIVNGKVHIVKAGYCAIIAEQAGNSNYNPAQTNQSLTINKANQTITFDSIPDGTYGQVAPTLNATASSGLPCTFSSSNRIAISTYGNTLIIYKAGSTIISANQSGNENYNPAPQVNRPFTAHKAEQIITFNALPVVRYGTGWLSISASSSSGLAVSFSSSNSNIASVSGTNGLLVTTGTGTCTISAFQNGDDRYKPAQTVNQTFVVEKADQNLIYFRPLEAKTYGDPDFEVYASVDTQLPITFSSSNTNVATITNNIVKIKGAGSCYIYANQAGNNNYKPFSVSKLLTVDKARQSVEMDIIPDKTYGDPDFIINAHSSSGLPVIISPYNETGTIVIKKISSNLFRVAKPGFTTIVAYQEGNENYLSGYDLRYVTVNKATPIISLPALDDVICNQQYYEPKATSNCSLPISYYFANPQGEDPVMGNNADGKMKIIGSGSVTIYASQSGNDYYNFASTSQTLTVTKNEQNINIIETLSDNNTLNKVYGIPPFALVQTSSTLKPIITRSNYLVDILDNNYIRLNGVGNCTLTISQPGNSCYYPATTVSVNLSITYAVSGTKAVVSEISESELTNGNNNEVRIYPNPTSDKLYFDNIKEKTRIEIYDLKGRRIRITELDESNNIINIEKLAVGVYFIRLTTNEKPKMIKVVKK